MPIILLCFNMDSKLRRGNSAPDNGQSAAFSVWSQLIAMVTVRRVFLNSGAPVF